MRLSLLVLILLSLPLSTQLKALSNPNQHAIVAEPIIQQIYQLVDQRNANSPLFDEALKQDNFALQLTALQGLGRIGGAQIIDRVKPFLNHQNPELRRMAVFAFGISGESAARESLWQLLEKETEVAVKQEIYLALGNLGEDHLLSKMLQRLEKESSVDAQASLFQGLAIALTFHRDLKEDYTQLNLKPVIALFAQGAQKTAIAGYFLNRIPNVETLLSAEQLRAISRKPISLSSQVNLARLIGKVTKVAQPANRDLLAWAIEKSEAKYLPLQLEAIRAMQNMTDVPQALIQLGKMAAAEQPIVAQTALNVIASSKLQSDEVIKLFKQYLKHSNDAMVVEAINGLVQRQNKDQMSWAVELFEHPSSYVKISLISALNAKSENEPEAYPKKDFTNLLKYFARKNDPDVAKYATSILENKTTIAESKAPSPTYTDAMAAVGKKVTLRTTVGDITIELLAEAPYTSWHFLNNAKLGNFTNSYFSRVIGNFVAQGGDTIGDLQGSSGKTIREEINYLSHAPLTVGMATAGKDTGSSQFFINTARNPHLDRNYTVFGKVVAGQDVVMKMTNGVKVLDVELN